MEKKSVYKILYSCNNATYELYAKAVAQSHLFGFIEIEGMLFNEQSAILVDPTEEKVKAEMAGVSKSHIPLQAIIRIDEVDKQGQAKIQESQSKSNKVTNFPGTFSLSQPIKET